MSRAIEGVIAFSITPTKNDRIDEDRLCSHMDDLIRGGVNAITLFGSTGGVGSFSEDERKSAAERAIAHVAGRVPVLVGTGALNTAEAVRLSEHAQRCGASAALVVPISYWLLNDTELLDHYTTINNAISIPLAIYNSPRLTGIDMLPPLIAKLTELSNVKYLKESSPDMLRISQVKRLTGDELKIIAGHDTSVVEAVRVGADAWGAACANFMPATCCKLFSLLSDPARIAAARRFEMSIRPLTEYAAAKGLIRACHDALTALGKPAGPPRLPIGRLSDADFSEWRSLLLRMRESLGY